MKVLTVIFAVFALSVQAGAYSLSITGPSRTGLLEGATYEISWVSQDVNSVSIVAHGANTPLGGKSRGNFELFIAENVPAAQGAIRWTVPWIDNIEFAIKLKGYDASGQLAASTERNYSFRPAVLATRTLDGIYLDLHKTTDQRLYVQKNNRLTAIYLSTSSAEYSWRARNSHIKAPHDHAGVFYIIEKKPMHWSTLFNVPMPWAMRYIGGHFIHATKPEYYRYLGAAASSGCNRMHLADAEELYHSTPLGTRVEVIGPNG